MAGAIMAGTGGAMMIVPIVDRIIGAYTEGKRLDFEIAKVREQGAVARRAIKLKERELECNHRINVRKIESAERALDGALARMREEGRLSAECCRAIVREAGRLMDAIVSGGHSVETTGIMMTCYQEIQEQLRGLSADSVKSLECGFAACDRYVGRMGLSGGDLQQLGFNGPCAVQIENGEGR